MAADKSKDGTRRHAAPKPTGRPSAYTDEIAREICRRLIDGESLRAICEDDHMPSKSTVLLWAATNESFSDQYAYARELSAEADADDVAHYARMAATGKIEPAAATAAINGLKWSAGKRQPKKYGDKIAHVGGDEGDAPIQTVSRIELVGVRPRDDSET